MSSRAPNVDALLGVHLMRGWTPFEDDPRWQEEGYYDKVAPRLDVLAAAWSRIQEESERRHFIREQDLEGYFYEDVDDEDEEVTSFLGYVNLQDELERVQLQHIEEQLAKLGARMMRPYEHWNEDERLMEWMERDR